MVDESPKLIGGFNPASRALAVRVQRSQALHSSHTIELLRLPQPKTLRLSVASNAIVLAAEHHGAIALLISQAHYSTAHALMRPLVETTMRALWLTYLASFTAVDELTTRPSGPDLDRICRYFVKAKLHGLTPIAEAVLKQGSIFHSFAHAGIEQLVRRLRGYSEEEVLAALLISDVFSSVAIANAAIIFDDVKLHQLTAINGHPLAMENHYNFGGPLPEPGWTGALPTMPSWNDPK